VVFRAARQNFLPAVPAISAAATTATTASATTTAAESTSTTATTGRLRTRFVYVERATVHFRTVQLGDRVFRVPLFRHFDEGEAARLTRIAIRNNVYTLHIPVLGKCGVQFVLRSLIAQISDKDIGHSPTPLTRKNIFVRQNTGGEPAGRE